MFHIFKMYVEIRKSGKRKLYYLAHSLREGGRVRKVRRYLGADLTSSEINELRAKAEKSIAEQITVIGKISDPLHTVLSDAERGLLETIIAGGDIKIRHLSEEDWLKFTELFTYDTNAIEGSTVTAREVGDIIENNRWPADKSKWEISETYGVAQAVDCIRKTKEHISLELIKKLHEIVFKNSKEFASSFRGKGIEVVVADGIGDVIHRGAPQKQIVGLLKELVKWYEENKNNYPPIVLAAVVHNQFENIHPFQDGNGRVGRILLNNILLKHGMPPVNIELKNRRQYYSALQAYEKQGDIRPTIELILKEYKNFASLRFHRSFIRVN